MVPPTTLLSPTEPTPPHAACATRTTKTVPPLMLTVLVTLPAFPEPHSLTASTPPVPLIVTTARATTPLEPPTPLACLTLLTETALNFQPEIPLAEDAGTLIISTPVNANWLLQLWLLLPLLWPLW